MITNHKPLEVTQEQLSRLEFALVELRGSVNKSEIHGQAPCH